jgi:hypothetical protein
VLYFLVILSFFAFLTKIIKNNSFLLGYISIFVFFCIFLQLNF